jgi:DNA repair protein SbcC/Rad50
MIPLHLTLSGFLSYRGQVEVDFSAIELACISGSNGAGKSSLLDAITWVLFGQARKRDESLINARCETAQVSLIFAYENNLFRVQRILPRGKTSLLEFQIWQDRVDQALFSGLSLSETILKGNSWKPLTERTMRETQARIESTLRMDYETFVNASFFLQGKADQFTQQRPGDRKRILSSILGLEVWETYRQRAAERRRGVEAEIGALDGRLHEIAAELAEEEQRKDRLAELQGDLERLSQARNAQEKILENMREVAATLAEQAKLVENLERQLQTAERRLSDLQERLLGRQAERASFAEIIGREDQIRRGYADWQRIRAELEEWEKVAAQFREYEKRLRLPQDEINAARARLQHEQQLLQDKSIKLQEALAHMPTLQEQLQVALDGLQEAEAMIERRGGLEAELDRARQRQAEARAENPRLKGEMDELKGRIEQLQNTEGVNCPLCGQALSVEDRQKLIAELTAEGRTLGDRYRANLALLDETERMTRELQAQIRSLAKTEADLRKHGRAVDQIKDQIKTLEDRRDEWQKWDEPQLAKIIRDLGEESFAPQARALLAEIQAELHEIGYDAAAHEAARRKEVEGRTAEDDLRNLEKALATLAPLDREIDDLQVQLGQQREDVVRQRQEYQQADESLSAAQAKAPDLAAAERQLLALREQENRLRMEVGAANQKVRVLEDLKIRRRSLEAQREQKASLSGQYKQLERAFSKDGVPALLIEQALPQIESKANEILDRLSAGGMSVRFVTQSAYKDKRREDMRETLDLVISDSDGTRDYEMFSGGESFRVNFAVRLALSEVLARRAGARLQTLVVDEGFGSQDALGRQRLVEAINLVRQDFAKILVITHIDELKDAFPMRIEVEKTEQGSTAQIV